MYPVSERFKTAVKEQLKTSEIYGTIETRSGKKYKFDMNNIIDSQISLEESVAGAEITIGYVSASEFNIAIRGFHDNVYGLMGAVILPYYRLWFNETEFEDVPLGVFNVTEPIRRKENVYIVALDNMIRLDKGIEGVMAIGRPQNIIESLCNRCGVTLASSTADFAEFANSSMGFALEKDHNVTTCRDLLAWLCQATATVARCNRFGEIELLSVTNREIVEVFDVDHRFSESISDGLSRITGVSMKIGEKSYFTGTDDYILELEENPTLRYMTTEAQRKTFFQNILNKVSTAQYVPSEVEVVNNPALQAGDFVGLQLDTAGMNLLQNSGFKDDTTGWLINSGATHSVITDPEMGNVLKVTPNSTDWGSGVYQRVPEYNDGYYTLGVWLKADAPRTLGIGFNTHNKRELVELTTEWQYYTLTANGLEGGANALVFYSSRQFPPLPDDTPFYIACPMLSLGEEIVPYTVSINELYPNATSDGIIKSYITNHFWKYRGKHELESAGRSDLLRGNYSQASKSIASVQADSSQALADSLTALDLADNAMASADEKSTVFHSPTPPVIAGRKTGDTWFNTVEGAIYEFDEGDWVLVELGENALADLSITNAKIADAAITNAKIANLDASKITAGTIDVKRLRLENFETQSGKTKIDNEGRLETLEGKIADFNIKNNTIYSKRGDLYSLMKSDGDVFLATGSPLPNNANGATVQIHHTGEIVSRTPNEYDTEKVTISGGEVSFTREDTGSTSIGYRPLNFTNRGISLDGDLIIDFHTGAATDWVTINKNISLNDTWGMEINRSLVLTENTFFNTASTPTYRQISANDDLNDYTSPGIYWSSSGAITNTLQNCPHTGSAFRLEVVQIAGGYVIQKLTQAAYGALPIEWIRQYRNGTWGNWQNTQPVVGTYTGNGAIGRQIANAQVYAGAIILISINSGGGPWVNALSVSDGNFTVGQANPDYPTNTSGTAYRYAIFNI